MFITRGNLQGLYVDAHAHSHTSSHTLTSLPSFFFFSPLFFSLRGIYRDVKAVIGQVSGVELSDNRLVTVAAHEWGMERRRETEGIESLNSLLNQKVNWKSGEFRLPAETDRGAGSQVFISLFVNAGFITQSSTGAGWVAAASRSP